MAAGSSRGTAASPAHSILHADLTNRGPTFDMDLSELEHDGQPISYEEARQYFKRDPAHRCVRLTYSWLSGIVPAFSCCVPCLWKEGMCRLQGMLMLFMHGFCAAGLHTWLEPCLHSCAGMTRRAL